MTTAASRLALAALLWVSGGACSHGVSGSAERDASSDQGATDPGTLALAIRQRDGTPLPPVLGYGTPLAVEAIDVATNQVAGGAAWSASGTCAVDGTSGAINPIGFGTCNLTASMNGATATATFVIVVVTSLKITGDTSPFSIGETRTFTATTAGVSPDAVRAEVRWAAAEGTDFRTKGFEVVTSGNQAKVTAFAVGRLSLKASAGLAADDVSLAAVPSAIEITASATHVKYGTTVTINAKAFGPGGVPCAVADALGMYVTYTTCLGITGDGKIETDGSVTFVAGVGNADCPGVTVSDLTTVSNALSFTVDTYKIASVVIQQVPADPVVVGSMVSLRAVALDAGGLPIDAPLSPVAFNDANDVYMFTVTGTLEGPARIAKTGTAKITAIIEGVQSAPVTSRAVPAGVALISLEPATIPVGGKAPLRLRLLALGDALVFDTAVAQISVAASDPTKVSFDTGTANGLDFTFVGTGLAPTELTVVTATWTDGKTTLVSGPLWLAVTSP